jgi:hypothetical protein
MEKAFPTTLWRWKRKLCQLLTMLKNVFHISKNVIFIQKCFNFPPPPPPPPHAWLNLEPLTSI